MNPLDIIQPDFKLTGLLALGQGDDINITKQRKIIPHNYKEHVDSKSILTTSMQLNKPTEYWTKLLSEIPTTQEELFIATLGRKEYYDEVLLPLALNTIDEFEDELSINTNPPNNKRARVDASSNVPAPMFSAPKFDKYLKLLTLVHDKLSKIVADVMILTAGSKGSRRPIYQHYFYSQKQPKIGDAVLSGLIGMKLLFLDYNTHNFKSSLNRLRTDLIALYNSEDIPIVDLIDLTLDQFNTIIKLLPKDNVWLKTRKDRSKFFDTIETDLNKVSDMSDKFNTLQLKFNELSQRRDQPNIKLEELQALSEIINKDTVNTAQQKIASMTTALNAFTSTYNSSGVLKYRGKTLARPSSMINDLLNSEFIVFLHTFKNQHKKMLVESIKDRLPAAPTGDEVSNKLDAVYDLMRKFTTDTNNLNTFNEILQLLALYKNVQYTMTHGETDTQVPMRIKAISEYIDTPSNNAKIVGQAIKYLQTQSEVDSLIVDIKSEVLRLQGSFFQPTIRNIGSEAMESFDYLYLLGHISKSVRIADTLTILSALLPIEYVDRLEEFTNVSEYFKVYGKRQDTEK